MLAILFLIVRVIVMKLENIGVVPPAVNGFRRHLAEGYRTPHAMVHEGKEIANQGFGILAAGLGIMVVGGSIDAVAGKRDQLYGAGRLVWAAGVLASGGGVARITQGEIIKTAGIRIQQAVNTGQAKFK
jgi:hypothetical protein